MPSSQKRWLRFTGCLSAFTFSGAQLLMVTLYPVLAEELHLSLSFLISCFSLGSLLFVVGSPFWSQKSDSWGRLQVLRLGVGSLCLSFASIVFLVDQVPTNSTFTLLILVSGRILYGLIASSVVPVAQALQSDLMREAHSSSAADSTRAMALHSMSLSLGRVVGVALLVLFHDHFKTILFVYLAFISLVLLLLCVSSSELFQKPASQGPTPSWQAEAIQIQWILAIALSFACFMETLNSSIAGTIKNLFHLDSHTSSGITGQVLLLASIGIFLIQAGTRLFAKDSWRSSLFLGVSALAVGSILLAVTDSFLKLWVSMGFLIIGIGIVPPIYLSLLKKGSVEGHYGKRVGIIGSVHTLGYALGGGLSALAFKTEKLPVGAILCLIAGFLAVFCLKQSTENSSPVFTPLSEEVPIETL